MKKLLFITVIIANGLLFAMDRPDNWKPSRPSGSGRPRPQVINFGTAPLTPEISTSFVNPLHESTDSSADDTQLSFFMNPLPAAATPKQVINPMHIINTGTIPAAATPIPAAPALVQAMSAKEQDRLRKIEKDLDKIEDVLKEMGIDLGCAALSAACLDPIGAAFSASSSIINIPKLAYYYGNMQKHIFYLSSSKTSPAAQARLKQLTPRLQTVSRVIAKGPESLQKLIKKFSKEETKEAK